MERENVYAYVKNNGPRTYIVTASDGKESKKRLFISATDNICEFAPRSRRRGYPVPESVLTDWIGMRVHRENNNSKKYIKYAQKATFPSAFVRKCLAADPMKCPYENHLSTGCKIDNEVITLAAVEKFAPYEVARFCKALAERTSYSSGRFDFRGYDGSLWIEVVEKDNGYDKAGDIRAGLSKEFRGCGNGYYYALVNAETFIGTDVD